MSPADARDDITLRFPEADELEAFMGLALAAAEKAAALGEVPIGAAVVHAPAGGSPSVVSVRHNERESSGDPTAHAEVLALRDAARELGRRRLEDCVLVTTLEPCPMCAGALWAARIGGVVQAAANLEAGALGSLYNLAADPRLNHEFPVVRGPLADESAAVLQRFFAARRGPARSGED